MLRIKKGVSIAGIRPEMVVAIFVVEGILASGGYETVITAALDSKHGRGSLHFVGLALDFRTRHIEDDLLPVITDEIKQALGESYDVVLEHNHWHVECQPKTGANL